MRVTPDGRRGLCARIRYEHGEKPRLLGRPKVFAVLEPRIILPLFQVFTPEIRVF